MNQKESFEQMQKKEYNKILKEKTKQSAKEEALKKYRQEFEAKQLKKEAREKAFKAAKETVKKIAKYIPRNQKTQPAKGLKNYRPSRQAEVRRNVRRDTGESYAMPTQEPWHREMLAPRDNGYRPHVPKSLVVEPDVEGYSRNLLLQPYKNIWDEPRKPNVWDETFKKKKSVFE